MTTTLLKANMILTQLGGAGRLGIMIGAHQFLGDEAGTLQFKFKARAKQGINSVRIVLDRTDTYTLELHQVRKGESKLRYSVEGIYDSNLKSIIERETGLALSL